MNRNNQRLPHAKEAFSPKGLFSSIPGFEYRWAQVKMASLVWEIFRKGGIGLIEAGTGTGKSLAYLYPAFFAQTSAERKETPEESESEEDLPRTIISTHTINLQQQLIEKEIPVLAGVTKVPLRASLLMGRANYLCRRKLALWQKNKERFTSEERNTIANLISSAENNEGCLEQMGIVLSNDLRTAVISESETCLRGHCPFFARCFWHTARKKAFNSQVVVVNHHLFFADLALRKEKDFSEEGLVLPPYKAVVFDEAHHIEEVAATYLGMRVDENEVEKFFSRLLRKDGRWGGGRLPALGHSLLDKGSDLALLQRNIHLLNTELIPGLQELEKSVNNLFHFIKEEYFCPAEGREVINYRFTSNLQTDDLLIRKAVEDICRLAEAGEKKISHFLDELQEMEGMREDSIFLAEAGRYLCKLRSDLPQVLNGAEEEYVHWLEVKNTEGKQSTTTINRLPLFLGNLLHKHLFSKIKSVVCTSATLAVGKNFTFIRERLGLEGIHPSERRECILKAPFNYNRQALVILSKEVPSPESPRFLPTAINLLPRIIEATGGRTLLLFTNNRQMREVYLQIAPVLLDKGYTLYLQGEMPRNLMLQRFKTSPRPVLFGADSFWEGVDLPGPQLSTVVIMRLPFRVPTEPFFQAKSEALTKEGKEPFLCLSLPEAVLRFKQGFGRLIRTTKDRGVIIVLDQRICTKNYGKIFLSSIPGGIVLELATSSIPEKVSQWLDE